MRFGVIAAGSVLHACTITVGVVSLTFAQGTLLTSSEIEAMLPGKVLSYRHAKRMVGEPRKPTAWVPRSDGSYSVVEFNLRSDRSVHIRCTNFARNGTTSPCRGLAANDVGVWSVEREALCLRWLNWGTSEDRCYRFLRAANGFRAERISGWPSSMDGELVSIR
jgi:hypothetical protein